MMPVIARKTERLLNLLAAVAALVWVAGAILIAVWMICHEPL